MSTSSLLVAAFRPELADLAAAAPPGWRTAIAGVGAVTAAATTARLLAGERPERLLFVGTCGAYDARLAIGDLLAARAAIVSSLDELEGRASRPELEAVRFETSWTPPLALPVYDVVVPPAVTRTAEGAQQLAALGAAEHLELAGVLAACADAGVPAAAVLAVANRVGPDASAEWRANHARVSRALVEALRPFLAAG